MILMNECIIDAAVIARFSAGVNRGADDECWPWIRSRVAGYGALSGTTATGKHKQLKSHRVALLLSGVAVPDRMCVCHRCDNPPCCNPAHLFLGTIADNTRDRDAKGRQARTVGEDAGTSKLTAEQVMEIRRRVRAGETQKAMSIEFGVMRPQIHRIITGERWAHLPGAMEGPIDRKRRTGEFVDRKGRWKKCRLNQPRAA